MLEPCQFQALLIVTFFFTQNFTAELYIQIAVNRQLCVGNSNLICVNSNFSDFPWKSIFFFMYTIWVNHLYHLNLNLGIILDFNFFLITVSHWVLSEKPLKYFLNHSFFHIPTFIFLVQVLIIFCLNYCNSLPASRPPLIHSYSGPPQAESHTSSSLV